MTVIAYETTALSTTEQTELERCEQHIEHLRQAFVDAGSALATVREQRLYRAQYRTFEEYCQERWGFSRVQAHRLIQAAEVTNNLLPIGNIVGLLPENEAQARPLGKLETPEEQQEAWKEAVRRSDGKPNARVVGEVVQEHTNLVADDEPAPPPEAPPPEKDAFENGMRGAMVGVELDDPAMVEEEDELEVEPSGGTARLGLQPDFTYVMSPSEKRQCSEIGDQYGCTVRQVVDGQGRGQELWNATCEGVTIATTNTLKNMPVYIEQAIAWKSEYEHEMAKRGHHLVTMVGTDKARFAVDYLPKTASGGLQTVDLSLSRIAAIRKRSLKHQGAINIYLSMLAQDGHLVSAVHTDNPAELYAWLEQQGYQFCVTTWQAEQEVEHKEEDKEMILPEGWKLRTGEGGSCEAYKGTVLFGKTHANEEAAIREAITLQSLYDRLHQRGWDARYIPDQGWHIKHVFDGSNAHGDLDDFLYMLEHA